MACGHPPHRLAAFAGLREMTAPLRKRPRDFNQAAKMVIDIATGQGLCAQHDRTAIIGGFRLARCLQRIAHGAGAARG
jgi:hypothetical protein